MRLDALVTGRQFFASVDRYGTWLQHSHDFHERLQRALERSDVGELIADWPERKKTALIEQDLLDLRLKPAGSSAFGGELRLADDAECLGALYVMEGASMGARVLLIAAHRLGLGATHGARHLTAAASSMQHWKTFVALLEAAPGDTASEERLIDAARRTFDLAFECFANPA